MKITRATFLLYFGLFSLAFAMPPSVELNLGAIEKYKREFIQGRIESNLKNISEEKEVVETQAFSDKHVIFTEADKSDTEARKPKQQKKAVKKSAAKSNTKNYGTPKGDTLKHAYAEPELEACIIKGQSVEEMAKELTSETKHSELRELSQMNSQQPDTSITEEVQAPATQKEVQTEPQITSADNTLSDSPNLIEIEPAPEIELPSPPQAEPEAQAAPKKPSMISKIIQGVKSKLPPLKKEKTDKLQEPQKDRESSADKSSDPFLDSGEPLYGQTIEQTDIDTFEDQFETIPSEDQQMSTPIDEIFEDDSDDPILLPMDNNGGTKANIIAENQVGLVDPQIKNKKDHYSEADITSQPGKDEQNLLMKIIFDVDSVELNRSQKNHIDSIVKSIDKESNYKLRIVGYASSGKQKDTTKARRISLQRVIEMRKYLLEIGIDPKKMNLQAQGDTSPDSDKDKIEILYERV